MNPIICNWICVAAVIIAVIAFVLWCAMVVGKRADQVTPFPGYYPNGEPVEDNPPTD